MSKTTHAERTAAEPRHSGLHAVRLCRIQRVAPSIRLLTLALPYAIHFLPGQWLDVHIPSLPSPGGFTITSPPSRARAPPSPQAKRPPTLDSPSPSPSRFLARFPALPDPVPSTPLSQPYVELAVQRTSNPPAQWLWQPESKIINSELQIRVGGSFTWPPENWGGKGGESGGQRGIEKVVFVAGGVGINPFMSMLGAMFEDASLRRRRQGDHPERNEDCPGLKVELLYSSKHPGSNLREILFLERLVGLAREKSPGWEFKVRLHLTGEDHGVDTSRWIDEVRPDDGLEIRRRRIEERDLIEALGTVDARRRGGAVAYVCGPGPMVDDVVEKVKAMEGMGNERVFLEKWW